MLKQPPFSSTLPSACIVFAGAMCSCAALCEMSPSRPPMDSIIFSTRMARSSPDFPQARFPGVVLHGILITKQLHLGTLPSWWEQNCSFSGVAHSLCTAPCDLHSREELLRKGTQVHRVASYDDFISVCLCLCPLHHGG